MPAAAYWGGASSSAITASTVDVRSPRCTAVIRSCCEDTFFPRVLSPPNTLATADALTMSFLDLTQAPSLTAGFPFSKRRQLCHLAHMIPPNAQQAQSAGVGIFSVFWVDSVVNSCPELDSPQRHGEHRERKPLQIRIGWEA